MSSRAFFCVLAFFVVAAKGKVFKPEELAQLLRAHNVSDWDIPSLVCVAHKISGLDTRSVKTRTDQSKKSVTLYGVFGLEKAEDDETYHECYCGLRAQQLTDDDVDDDIDCLIGCMADTVLTHSHHHALSDYLNIYHEVDMKHCFHWWRKLPPVVFGEDSGHENMAKTHHLLNTHGSEAHHPFTTNFKCHCCDSSIIVEMSLVFLNLILIALCYVVWSVFGQRKFIRHEFVNITDRS